MASASIRPHRPAGPHSCPLPGETDQRLCYLWLVDRGAAVNRFTEDGSTALSYAAGRGHDSVVELLIKCGAELDHRDAGGATALLTAAREGREAAVKPLIEAGAPMSTAAITRGRPR
ncbi:MAG: hypothetical protein DMG39_11255 [Acidobacteria bacterium]|nr:MAG: hypothetical protein DMG39_11255 [Acidobacteriota bacterium]